MSYPTIVRNSMDKMTEEQRREYLEEYRRKKKSYVFAYFSWVLVGFHYAYLGKWGVQLVFWLTCGGLFIWYFIDIFRIPGLVDNKNREIAVEALKDWKILSS